MCVRRCGEVDHPVVSLNLMQEATGSQRSELWCLLFWADKKWDVLQHFGSSADIRSCRMRWMVPCSFTGRKIQFFLSFVLDEENGQKPIFQLCASRVKTSVWRACSGVLKQRRSIPKWRTKLPPLSSSWHQPSPPAKLDVVTVITFMCMWVCARNRYDSEGGDANLFTHHEEVCKSSEIQAKAGVT